MSERKREDLATAEKFSRVFFSNSKENLILDRDLRSLDRGERTVVRDISTSQKMLCRRFHRKIAATRLSSARASGDRVSERELRQGLVGGAAIGGIGSRCLADIVALPSEEVMLTKIWKSGSLAYRNPTDYQPQPQLQLPGARIQSPVRGGKPLPACSSRQPDPTGRESQLSHQTSLGRVEDMLEKRQVTAEKTAPVRQVCDSSKAVEPPSASVSVPLRINVKSARQVADGVSVSRPHSKPQRSRDSPKSVHRGEGCVNPVNTGEKKSGVAGPDAALSHASAAQGLAEIGHLGRVGSAGLGAGSDGLFIPEGTGTVQPKFPLGQPRRIEVEAMSFGKKTPGVFGRGLGRAVDKREKVNTFGIALSAAVPKPNRAVHRKEDNIVIRFFKRKLRKTPKRSRVGAVEDQPEEGRVEKKEAGEEQGFGRVGSQYHGKKAVLTIQPQTAHELSSDSSVPRISSARGRRPSIVRDKLPLAPPLTTDALTQQRMLAGGSGWRADVSTPAVQLHRDQFMLGSTSSTSRPTSVTSRPVSAIQEERIRSARYDMRVRNFCAGLDHYTHDSDRQIKDYYFLCLRHKKGTAEEPSVTDFRRVPSPSLQHAPITSFGGPVESRSEAVAAVLPSESELRKYGGNSHIRNMTFKVLNWDFAKAGCSPSHRDTPHCS